MSRKTPRPHRRYEPRKLSEEERVLWHAVARTTTPMRGSASIHAILPTPDDASAPNDGPEKAPAARTAKGKGRSSGPISDRAEPPQPAMAPASLPGFDRKTQAKLKKGRLPIEARIDLHGMVQDRAHGALLTFLHQARNRGLRHVLVITGKGTAPASEGILNRSVPLWLATPLFRSVVAAHQVADRRHGGAGAIYVRLRRT